MTRCNNCGDVCAHVSTCPCGLGNECPINGGVCDHCHTIILRNAQQRAGQRSRGAA